MAMTKGVAQGIGIVLVLALALGLVGECVEPWVNFVTSLGWHSMATAVMFFSPVMLLMLLISAVADAGDAIKRRRRRIKSNYTEAQ